MKTFALAGVGETREAAEDLRLWEVKTRQADDPEGDSTEYLNAEQVAARAKTSPLYALALTMRGDDSLKLVSADDCADVQIKCTEPEEAERFDSFTLARREARARALRTGSNQEVRFDGSRFRVYSDQCFPPAPIDFERVTTVEPPVVFRIQASTIGPHSTVDGPQRWSVAEVFCDDSRANPDLQAHGESLIYGTKPFQTPEAAALDAAEWIRAEFPTLDAEIQSPFDVEDDGDIPL